MTQYKSFEAPSDLGTRDMKEDEVKMQREFLKKNGGRIFKKEEEKVGKVRVKL